MKENCICRHFSCPTYNREILSREDHINLLATPKGYRWYGPEGEKQLKKKAFHPRSPKQTKLNKVPVFPGMAQFMGSIWNLLTPEMLVCLKKILENEFGMDPHTAVLFIVKQYLKSKRLPEMENGFPPQNQVDWAKNIASILASKMAHFTNMMTDYKKTKRSVLLHQKLLDRLRKMFGIKPSDSPLNKYLGMIVDGLTAWLSTLPVYNTSGYNCSDLTEIYSQP